MTLGPLNKADDFSIPMIGSSGEDDLRLNGDIHDPIGAPRVKAKGKKPPKKPSRAPVWPWIAIGVVVGSLGLSVVLRKEIAAAYVTSWLKSEGISAKVKIAQLGLSHLEGGIVIGPEATPELKVNSFGLDYRLAPFAPKANGFFQLKAVRLTGLDATLSLKDGQFNYGSLNTVVQNALKAPAKGPALDSVVLEDATVRLNTDYGQVRAKGGLSLAAGRLNFLSLTLPNTHLNGPLGEGELLSGHVRAEAIKGLDGLKVEGDILAGNLILHQENPTAAEEAGGFVQSTSAEGVALSFDGTIPYAPSSVPQSGFEMLKGAFAGKVAVRAQTLVTDAAEIGGLEGQLSLKGNLLGSASGLAYEGEASLLGRSESLKSGDLDTQGLRLEGPSLMLNAAFGDKGLRYNVAGPVSGHVAALRQADIFVQKADLALSDFTISEDGAGFNALFEGVAYTPRAGMGDLSFDTLNLDLKGAVKPDGEDQVIDVSLNAMSDAAHYTGLHGLADGRDVPVPNDSPHPRDAIVALDRAFERFGLRARGVKINLRNHPRLRPPSVTIGLSDGLTATFADGGVLKLNALGDKTVINQGTGGHIVADLSGGSLPTAKIEVARLRFTDQTRFDLVAGDFVTSGMADVTPAQGMTFAATGQFASDAELNVNFDLKGPVLITAKSVILGDRLEDVSLELYQTGQHFIRLAPDGFYLNGHFANASLMAPNEQVILSGGEGALSIAPKGPNRDTAVHVDLKTALMTDIVPEEIKRFYPLTIAGTLNQDPLSASGAFALSSTKYMLEDGTGFKVANVILNHNMRTNAGTLKVSTGDLNFVKGALQPTQLTPQVESLMSREASGTVSFDGGLSWTKDTNVSNGVLKIQNMGFSGATHIVKGVNGEIVFDSLAPLHTKAGQSVTVNTILAGAPLSNMDVALQFDNDHINIEHLLVQTEGGEVRLAPMKVMMDAKSAMTGEIQFNHLDMGKVIKGTELSKSIVFTGLVSGRLPFSMQGQKFMIFDGKIDADGAGRISIPRGGVTNMDGGTAVAQATDGTKPIEKVATQEVGITDLAYQAMENLAFESLNGTINSLPTGILDINFHIKGHFDPPKKQQTKVSLFDFITGKWVDKPIKLQSGAKIELYLNVPLNLDTILQDLDQLNRHSATK